MATTTTTDFNNLAFINDTDNVENILGKIVPSYRFTGLGDEPVSIFTDKRVCKTPLEYMSNLLQNKNYLNKFTFKFDLSKDISYNEYKCLLVDFFYNKVSTWKKCLSKICLKNLYFENPGNNICLFPTIEHSFLLDHPTDKDVCLLVIPPCLNCKRDCTHKDWERECINTLVVALQEDGVDLSDDYYKDVMDKHYESIREYQQLRRLNRKKEFEKKISDGTVVKVSLSPTLESAFSKNFDSLINCENIVRTYHENCYERELTRLRVDRLKLFLKYYLKPIKDELHREYLCEFFERIKLKQKEAISFSLCCLQSFCYYDRKDNAYDELSKSSKYLSQALETFKEEIIEQRLPDLPADTAKCVACYSDKYPPVWIAGGCGHRCYCDQCIVQINSSPLSSAKKCPLCRSEGKFIKLLN
jgi:hypothetical protein